MSIFPAARPRESFAPSWQWSRLADLAVGDFHAAMAARQAVFVVEQRCAYLDADGLDPHAWHLLGWDRRVAPSPLACYLRVVDPGYKFPEPSIGRVLTARDHRGTGLGRALMREGLAGAARLHPGRAIRIAAQRHLEGFYASLGFRTVGAPFDEDGIPHVEMLREAPALGAAAVAP